MLAEIKPIKMHNRAHSSLTTHSFIHTFIRLDDVGTFLWGSILCELTFIWI